MTNAFICNSNSTKSVLGMNSTSKSWNQLIGDIGMGGQSDYIKLTYPVGYSSSKNITWCSDDLSNCTNVNTYANCSDGGTGKTDCKIPTSLGFSAYVVTSPVVVAPQTPGNTGGTNSGGGGGGSAGTAYNITDSEFSSGISKSLAKSDRIKFTFKSVSHSIILASVLASEINVTVSSTIQRKTIALGNDAKFDLDGEGKNDLSITYSSYANNKATIYIKEITTTTTPTGTGNVVKEPTTSARNQTTTQSTSGKSPSTLLWIIGIIVVIAIIVIVYLVVGIYNKKRRYY